MDSLYTRKRYAQYRGPSTSDEYNKRIEENYKDLVTLLNRTRLSEIELSEIYRRTIKNQISLNRVIDQMENRLQALEDQQPSFNFFDHNHIDNERFVGTAFELDDPSSPLSLESRYGLLTLPKIDSGSLSKLFFIRHNGEEVVPSSFNVRIVPDEGSADNSTAEIDQSPPEHSLVSKRGYLWERNVVHDTYYADGAAMDVYIKVPTGLFSTAKSNAITLHPYPILDCDIEYVGFTTKVSPSLNENDSYIALNQEGLYTGNLDSQGWVPPGGWGSPYEGDDIIADAGPKMFYFPPKPITALKITLRQNRSFLESNKYIYSYGLMQLDLRQNKFKPEGETILRFDAPSGEVINQVSLVEPTIYNIPQGLISSVFDYEVIWETAYQSGEYTSSSVPGSQRVWIKIKLIAPESDWSPTLNSLSVDYS